MTAKKLMSALVVLAMLMGACTKENWVPEIDLPELETINNVRVTTETGTTTGTPSGGVVVVTRTSLVPPTITPPVDQCPYTGPKLLAHDLNWATLIRYYEEVSGWLKNNPNTLSVRTRGLVDMSIHNARRLLFVDSHDLWGMRYTGQQWQILINNAANGLRESLVRIYDEAKPTPERR